MIKNCTWSSINIIIAKSTKKDVEIVGLIYCLDFFYLQFFYNMCVCVCTVCTVYMEIVIFNVGASQSVEI